MIDNVLNVSSNGGCFLHKHQRQETTLIQDSMMLQVGLACCKHILLYNALTKFHHVNSESDPINQEKTTSTNP